MLINASVLLMGSLIQGVSGQELQVSNNKIFPNQNIVVTGKNFDTSVGIYLALCKVPEYGKPPTPCGGGINKTGKLMSSIWISNNAPTYGKDLATKFGRNGSFKHIIRLSPKIGAIDCRKVQCAITVRADHTRSTDRNSDLFIPITFKSRN